MKTTGTLLRVIAIIAFVALFCGILATYALNVTTLEDYRIEAEEDYEEHEDEFDGRYHDEDDCWECENYEDSKKTFDRQSTQYLLSAMVSFVSYSLFCAILYGVGAIISSMSMPKKGKFQSAPTRVPQSAPPADFCPICGSKRRTDDLFCCACGSAYTN